LSKKNKKVRHRPKQIRLTQAEVKELQSVIDNSNLPANAMEIVLGLVNLNGWLSSELEKGNLTIHKLRKLLGIIASSEKAGKRKERKDKANKGSNDDQPSGHGRNHSDEYTGAENIEVKHDTLQSGDDCPIEDCVGKLYNIDPGVVINIVGSPIASAKKYIIEKLRCALCGEQFVAPAPGDMNANKRYSESFAAMLMINKYFTAVPLYRQDTLQKMLGVPLPSSTQWEIMKAYEPTLEVVYHALVRDAANGKGFHLDDTSAKILEVIKQRETEGKKSSKCYTTGMISVHDDHRCAIFITDQKTAGKTFAPIWAFRDKSLPEPYIMADALSANIPEEVEKGLYTMCYCLVHARRNFYDLGEGYDDLVDVVIHLIGKLYDNESQAKKMLDEKRLAYHQDTAFS